MLRIKIVDDNVTSQEILSHQLKELTLRQKLMLVGSDGNVAEDEAQIYFVSTDSEYWEGRVNRLVEQSKAVVILSYDPRDALRAINLQVFGFLLKPLDSNLLSQLIKKWIGISKNKELGDTSYRYQEEDKYFGVQLTNGISVLKKDEVRRIEADNNYSVIYTTAGEKIISAKTLKYFEENIDPRLFIRVHKSHIINIKELKWIENHSSGELLLRNGDRIAVARRKRAALLMRLKMM